MPAILQMDMMKFETIPTGIALSESGFAAISYNQGSLSFVILLCPDGATE